MTIDEELAFLEENVRRLKVEYDIYFGGGSRRAPTDLDWRVQGLIKKYSDSQKLTSQQRFKYNTVVQRYATYSDLWRQKLRIREEGYRRPQDALLGIQGLRPVKRSTQQAELAGLVSHRKQSLPSQPTVAQPSSRRCCCLRTQTSWTAFGSCTRRCKAARVRQSARFAGNFAAFLRAKTKEIQNTYGCSGVKYTVEVKNGRAQIKAKPNL